MRTIRTQLGDIALALALVVVGVIGTAASGNAGSPVSGRPIDALGYVLVVAAGAALVTRRRWPLATLTVAAILTATYLGLGYPYGPILLSFFVAVYTAARHRPLDRSLPMAAVAVLLLLTHLFTNDAALPGLLGVIPASAWVAVPFAIGVTVKVTREAAARERAEFIRQRVDNERLRVIQEVHDIVGHGLAAIRMQADVAVHVLPKKPEQAQVALDAISRSSGQALDELRATLGAIRAEDGDTDRSPTPSLSRLDDLGTRMTDAGAQIRIETVGVARELPAAVDLGGYRIVQESLTNVLRHSETKVARVTISYEPDAVVVSISNPAPGRAPGAIGLGISGMRRRVTSLGGDFSAGLTADDRFEVRAVLPTNELS